MTIRLSATLILAAMAVIQSGCAMCCGVDDYNYGTYGGKWQRTNPAHGRVGSPFSDAGDVVVTSDAEPIPESIPTPGPDPDSDPINFY